MQAPFNIRLFLAVSCVLTINTGNAQETSSKEAIHLLQSMFDSVYAIQYAKFEMFSKERIEGEFVESHAVGVMQYEPRKVFIRGLDEEGVLLNEVLYINGKNNGNALISPNGFPYINLNLNPEGSAMRKNRHFTILEAGGRYLVDMLKLGMTQYAQMGNMQHRFFMEDESSSTWKVTISNTDYAFKKYTVREGENSRTIAKRLGVPEYKMVELNEDIDDYDDIRPEQTLTVPNLYAKKVELILRKNDLIPIQVRIYDDQGLYSEYVYTVFDTHPTVNDQTFNSDNPAYTF